ncbi:MAG TPA: hypothetical protein DCQ98_01810 [Planctomycetaceae bacterium]|nr:hypothetical protein [Planctomycetaceae bacterium]HRF02127.1 hypothetical protein [Pirellulaceae bacterium]
MSFLTRTVRRVIAPLVLLSATLFPSVASAQYVQVGSPFRTFTDSYYERIGVNFGFDLPGGGGIVGLNPDGSFTPDGRIRFSQGSFGSAVPPFGGYDPGADAHLGFRVGGGNGPGFNFNLAMGQGSSRTGTVVDPTIVMPNGVPGMMFDGQFRPFVTGIVPVVGFMPPQYYTLPPPTVGINPIAYRLAQLDQLAAEGRLDSLRRDDRDEEGGLSLDGRGEGNGRSTPVSYSDSNSSATRGARSVAELKRAREAAVERAERERQERIAGYLAAADDALAKKLPRAARYNLERALREANENERADIEARLEALDR